MNQVLINTAIDSAEQQARIESTPNQPQITDNMSIETVVDRIAFLKAKVAEIREEEDALKAILIASGKSVVESTFFRCTVSDVAGRPVTDWQTIAMKFAPSRQLIKAHTKDGASYTQIRVFARKGGVK